MEELCQALSEQNRSYKIRISYGIAYVEPTDDKDIEYLLRKVDEKMYVMKQKHKLGS